MSPHPARTSPSADTLALDVIADLAARGHDSAAREALLAAIAKTSIKPASLGQATRLAQRLAVLPPLFAMAARLEGVETTPGGFIELALAAMGIDAFADASALLRRVVATRPDDGVAAGLFGASLFYSGETAEATVVLEAAIAKAPANAVAQRALGLIKLQNRDIDGAIAALSVAVAAEPENAISRVNLGRAFVKKGRYEDAFLMIQSALESKAARGSAFLALAYLYRTIGNIERVAYYYRQAVDESPTPDSITSYLFYLLASDQHSDEEVFAEHKRLGAVFDNAAALTRTHSNDPDPNRRLRIGFVSGDFYQHSVARFITPLVRGLDRTRFELFGIYNNSKRDPATLVLQQSFDHWLQCYGMSDEDVAAWIEARQIDVLIDLSGHTALHRLSLFGRRPAPVQASYLGYPGTTGMRAMDYRITCELLDATGESEHLNSERLIRLPGIFAPFQSLTEQQIAPSPCLNGAPFTFAAMTPTWRITSSAFDCWARILEGAPGSRLLFGNVDTPMVAQYLVNKFAERGIEASRLSYVPRLSHQNYIALHSQIDLMLDPFPYNGGTTNSFALWMGVPVVALQGRRPSARTGAGILSEAGLTEFIAQSPDDYVRIALDWAARPQDLAEVRAGLRGRMRIGNADDQALFATQFGDALSEMWRDWCARVAPAEAKHA